MITLNPGESLLLRANKNLGVSYYISGIQYTGSTGSPKKLSSGEIETTTTVAYTSPSNVVTVITSILISNPVSNDNVDVYIFHNEPDPHLRIATILIPSYGYSEWSGGITKIYDKDGVIKNTSGGTYQLNSYFP